MSAVIIGVDNGNGYIKTEHEVFPCGLKMQEIAPSEIFSKDILEYNGLFYTLTPNSMAYQTDKTTNDDAFILTLFGIAKEIIARARENKQDFDFKKDFTSFVGKDVVLAVGLPPAHLERQLQSFKNYFVSRTRNGVNFKYNNKLFSFYIKDVVVLPQDYAGVIAYESNLLTEYPTVYCIDIGNGTVDLVGLSDGVPDKEKLLSTELGMRKLQDIIINEVIQEYGYTLDNDIVENYFRGKKIILQPEIISRIDKTTQSFVNDLINQLHSKVPDFRMYPVVFMGGGSLALRKYFEESGAFYITRYIENVSANAVGYQEIAKVSLGLENNEAG